MVEGPKDLMPVSDAFELTPARKRLILLATILGSMIAFVDTSVVNVALPAIQDDLGGGLLGQQWVANAYLLTEGALLLVGGSLGDVYGQRRVFIAGLIAFAVFSAMCALAPSVELLVAGRALQGAAAAALVPMALALITTTFGQEERGKAIGMWTAWSGVGVAIGPLIGGQLVDLGSWRFIFAINLPLVAVTLALAVAVIPVVGKRSDRRLDLVGAALCSVSVGAMIFGLLQQPTEGWGALTVMLPLALGAALFAWFLLHEWRSPRPMLPLGLFRRRNFAVGNLETFAMYAGIGLLFFYLVIYLQQVAGFSALKAGVAMMPVTLLMLFFAGYFGGLADRLGPRAFMTAGPLIGAVGLALLLRLDSDVDFWIDLLPPLLLFSLGLAMTVAPLTATVLGDVDELDAGIASGANNAIARLAGMIGIAVVGVLIAASFAGDLDDRLADAELSPAGAEVVREAMSNPLLPPSVVGLPPPEGAAIAAAAEQASVDSFRLGMGITAALVAAAGLMGIAIRNPLRPVPSSDCPGGQLAGQPKDAARRPEECEPRELGTPGSKPAALSA
jgi:EmrB/QacA subfamily drug resistance transporter